MSTSEVEGKFSSKLKLPIRIWKDLKETTVGSLAYVSVSFKSGNFSGNSIVVRGAEVLTWWRVGEVRSSTLVSNAHRKSRRDWLLDNGKKRRQAFALSCYTSLKTGFFDCCYLVLFDSALLPTQPFCSPRVSQYNFQIFFPFKMRFCRNYPLKLRFASNRIQNPPTNPTVV